MTGATAGIAQATPRDLTARLREALAANPGGVLEELARREGATYRELLGALPTGEAIEAPSENFEAVWSAPGRMAGRDHLHRPYAGGVFETRGTVPPGGRGRGYFNIHGDSPIGGHIRSERCAAIYFVDRPFMGR